MSALQITIDLEKSGREKMYQQLCKEFSKKEVDETLEDQIIHHITQMFDQKEELKKMEK